jgi:hypothetical protein
LDGAAGAAAGAADKTGDIDWGVRGVAIGPFGSDAGEGGRDMSDMMSLL